jgi:hypothetical protein
VSQYLGEVAGRQLQVRDEGGLERHAVTYVSHDPWLMAESSSGRLRYR